MPSETLITAALVFFAYCIEVPSTGANVGSPSYFTVSLASARVMVAVCGIEFAIKASSACRCPRNRGQDWSLWGCLPESWQSPRKVLAVHERPWSVQRSPFEPAS